MNLREAIDANARYVVIGAACALILGLILIVLPSREPKLKPAKWSYFSNDDGKSFFTEDATKVAPFDKDGHEADAAYVYVCADGKRFIGLLERAANEQDKIFVESARKELIARAATQPMGTPDGELLAQINRRLEIKRPGDRAWVSAADAKAQSRLAVICPDGGNPVPVTP